jgi:pimeloyl-ACP methyl ester carboxylesterase/DNA-binding CsgD family transcriptional regulator
VAFKQDLRFTRSADGARLAYAVHGDGYPLVRAAHWLTNIESDWQSPVWRPMFDAYGSRYRFHRYDSRGCGLSDREATDVTLDLLVSDLEAVVDAAGLDRFALLGTSQGGAVSITYAARHPERVSHLVLLGAFVRGALVRARTADEIASINAQVTLVEVGWGQDHPAFLQLFTSQLFPNATPAQAHSLNELQKMSCSPAQASRIIAAYYNIDASEQCARVTTPTLVLHARGDLRIPFAIEGVYIASSIPGARLVPLETTSHNPLYPEPAFDRVIEEIEAFLPRTRAAAAFPTLTRREHEILELIARGNDNAQIAAHLALSEKTVRNHITNVFDKIGAENRSQAIVRAREAGLGIEPAS